MKKQMQPLSKQNGYTLIQVMLAIVVVGILSVITMKEAIDAWNDTKPDDMAREVSYLMGEMTKCATLNRGSYEKCDIDELVGLGYLDDETWGDGTGVNPYSGDYTASQETGNPNRFVITGTSITSDEHCARLVEMFSDRAKAVDCTSGTLTVTQGNS
ncbi:type II secretion system protein [Pseudoalteromonas nigrifaciens]|uniref:type II secretion system protein n=1 Tax=Pseudoalteromonas nigrifaciens TaxID=28109 RepID=UPI003FD5228F